MRTPYAAVIDLHEPLVPIVSGMIESMLAVARGVAEVTIFADHHPLPRIRVLFDGDLIAAGDIVQMIETLGWSVRAVGQLRLF